MPLPLHLCDSCRFVERDNSGKIPIVDAERPLFVGSAKMIPVKKISYYCRLDNRFIRKYNIFCKNYQMLPEMTFKMGNMKVTQKIIGRK